MVKAIQAARLAARKAIESTYDGVCAVMELKKEKDGVTKLTKKQPVIVLESQPCKLSFEIIKAVNQSESAASVTQTTKLFISPEIIIKPGSKITVTQAGKTTNYTCSGVPAVYDTHQEIMLELFEDWS